MSDTPITDDLHEFLTNQFPATFGNIELKNKLDGIAELERELAAMTKDRDSWCKQADDRIDDALKFARERDALRAHIEQLASEALDKDTLT